MNEVKKNTKVRMTSVEIMSLGAAFPTSGLVSGKSTREQFTEWMRSTLGRPELNLEHASTLARGLGFTFRRECKPSKAHMRRPEMIAEYLCYLTESFGEDPPTWLVDCSNRGKKVDDFAEQFLQWKKDLGR